MKIFISHSSQDAIIVKAIIELIRSALNIPASEIRCTSVDGYRLQGGVSTDEQIKKEVFESNVLLGVISPNSMQSTYVMFELGARWGIAKPMIPLATNNTSIELLRGPLKGINALNSSVRAQVLQLVSDLGIYLNVTPEAPSVYDAKVDEVVRLSLEETLPSPNPTKGADGKLNSKSSNTVNDTQSDYSDSDGIIKQHCTNEWPDDFMMQSYCIQQQKDSVKELMKGRPDDIPAQIFQQIRKKAAIEWPIDYMMRAYAEKTQIDSYRLLNA